jgi:hypothetical protein
LKHDSARRLGAGFCRANACSIACAGRRPSFCVPLGVRPRVSWLSAVQCAKGGPPRGEGLDELDAACQGHTRCRWFFLVWLGVCAEPSHTLKLPESLAVVPTNEHQQPT